MTEEQFSALLDKLSAIEANQAALVAALELWGMRLCVSVLICAGFILGFLLLWALEDIFKKS